MVEQLYLDGLEQMFTAAMPETDPRVVDVPSLGTKGLEVKMFGETSLIAVVDIEGWGLLVEGDPALISPLAPLDTYPAEVVFLIASRILRSFVTYFYPEPGTIDIPTILEGLGEGTRNHSLFMNMIRYSMMLKDGVVVEDNPLLEQKAHKMIEWLGNRGSAPDW